MIGTTLAHYQITAHLGSGGMGDVYQATDLKLGRSVAVKFLPDAFARDGERLARFEREARVLASLNHPNIAAIYGIEESRSGGSFSSAVAPGAKVEDPPTTALVMELVEGEDLSTIIARGPMALAEALPIARQITEALEAAHASGIIHRDLKPANIKVTPDGRVKVLDFGLAKALDPMPGGRDFSPAGAADRAGPADQSPTITTPAMTMRGMILGTAAYMSPEQARGKPVDRRADIWAFGVVLYEMLTGKHLFEGNETSDVLAAVLRAEPDWTRLPAGTPPQVRTLLRRCLQKDAKKRLADAADAQLEIDEALLPQEHHMAPAAANRSSRTAWSVAALFAAGIAVLLAGAMAVPTWRYLALIAEPVPAARFLVTAPNGGDLQSMVSVSPDGNIVAFISGSAGSGRLWLRRLGSTEAVDLEAATGLSTLNVFWSPDSRTVAFLDAGKLKATDLTTRDTRVICEVATAGIAGGTWGHDGTILLGSAKGILRVPAGGGSPEPVSMNDGADSGTFRGGPQFLPDGHHFLYSIQQDGRLGSSQWAIHVGDLRSGDAPRLLEANSLAQAASGFLLFVRAGTLFAQPFDARSFQLSGTATPIGQAPSDRPSFSASQNGILAIRSADVSRPPSDLAWIDRNGAERGKLKKPPTGDYANPAIAPDGRRVAVNSLDSRSGRNDIWIVDSARDVAERFTFGEGSNADPLWSPDGRQLAFLSERQGRVHIVAKATDGSREQVLEDLGPGTLDFQGAFAVALSDWSADGKFIVYTTGRLPTRTIRVLTVADRKSSALPLDAIQPYAVRFSRDGKWIAYAARDAGRFEVFIQAFPSLNRKRQVSNGGGSHPRWGNDDREIFYSTDRVQVVSLTESGADLIPGTPRVAYDRDMRAPLDSRNHFAVTPDAQRLLVRQPIGTDALSAVQVLVNWPAMLQK